MIGRSTRAPRPAPYTYITAEHPRPAVFRPRTVPHSIPAQNVPERAQTAPQQAWHTFPADRQPVPASVPRTPRTSPENAPPRTVPRPGRIPSAPHPHTERTRTHQNAAQTAQAVPAYCIPREPSAPPVCAPRPASAPRQANPARQHPRPRIMPGSLYAPYNAPARPGKPRRGHERRPPRAWTQGRASTSRPAFIPPRESRPPSLVFRAFYEDCENDIIHYIIPTIS